ncbi:MAG: hypothetical protein OHK0036_12600 [Bacteroidia bacterium]
MYSVLSLFETNPPENAEIIVFTENITNRLIYVLDFLIKRQWQKNYIITSDIEIFKSSDKLKINYSTKIFDNAVNVYPLNLLNSRGIDKKLKPDFSVNKNFYYKEDIFSKIFFHISRYEEWKKNFTPDAHQRFEPNVSIHQYNLKIPFVDVSIAEFKQFIQSIYPAFSVSYFYKEILTFDLDNILAFKGKSFLRTSGALIKHILKQEFLLLNERIKTILKMQEDPFVEVYRFIKNIAQQKEVIFFVLSKNGTSFDRAADIQHPDTKSILNDIKSFAYIGLHPSYYSFNNIETIKQEKHLLESVINETIFSSRQHYLRMDITQTPPLLLKCGILMDFTMGFASYAGFRAGTSYPFFYYDFDKEEVSSLLLVPFCAMDGAYFNYQKTSVDKAVQDIEQLKQSIKNVGGYFIPLFHEITLSPLFNKDALQWRALLMK